MKIRELLIHLLGGFTREDVLEAKVMAKEESAMALLEYKAIADENKRLAEYERSQREALGGLYRKTLDDKKQLTKERDFYETKAIAHESDVINLKQWLNKRGM